MLSYKKEPKDRALRLLKDDPELAELVEAVNRLPLREWSSIDGLCHIDA